MRIHRWYQDWMAWAKSLVGDRHSPRGRRAEQLRHAAGSRAFRPRLEQLEARAVPAGVWGDFNGDGYADLAVGSPGETVNGLANAGAVNILYGTSSGIKSSGGQLLTQNSAAFPIRAKADSQFGAALTVGDFNGDGYADLAVGAPYTTIGSLTEAGLVCVFYGSAAGLRTDNAQQWQQDTPGILHRSAKFDWFGFSLAAGDFNNDGRDDLVIGCPGNSPGNPDIKRGGTVFVIYGSASGLTAANNQTWDPPTIGVRGDGQVEQHYGWSVAVGDFNGDGFDDLAAGAPHTDGSIADAGAVSILFGSSSRLTATGSLLLTKQAAGIHAGQAIGTNPAGAGDQFGFSLTVGDFNGDGRDDLAIGSPGNLINGKAGAGAVTIVLGGSHKNLHLNPVQFWHAGNSGVSGGAQAHAHFGQALAAGNFNGDGRWDLAIGIPDQDLGTAVNAGAVAVLYGSSAAGLGNGTSQFWTQASLGSQTNQANARFGSTLAAADFNRDGRWDLVVGSPGRTVGGLANAGAINLIFGTSSGLSAAGFRFLTQNNLGFDPAEANDRFGGGLGRLA